MVISTHLPPPVMIDSTAERACVTHMLCWTCAMCFSAAASSENDQGSMNLASKTAPLPSTIPSKVAAIQPMAECLTRRCTSTILRPLLRSYQSRLSSSVAVPSCTTRLPERSSGSISPRFSRQRRVRAASSPPMMIRASEPPTKVRRSNAKPVELDAILNVLFIDAASLELNSEEKSIEIILIRGGCDVNRNSINCEP